MTKGRCGIIYLLTFYTKLTGELFGRNVDKYHLISSHHCTTKRKHEAHTSNQYQNMCNLLELRLRYSHIASHPEEEKLESIDRMSRQPKYGTRQAKTVSRHWKFFNLLYRFFLSCFSNLSIKIKKNTRDKQFTLRYKYGISFLSCLPRQDKRLKNWCQEIALSTTTSNSHTKNEKRDNRVSTRFSFQNSRTFPGHFQDKFIKFQDK